MANIEHQEVVLKNGLDVRKSLKYMVKRTKEGSVVFADKEDFTFAQPNFYFAGVYGTMGTASDTPSVSFAPSTGTLSWKGYNLDWADRNFIKASTSTASRPEFIMNWKVTATTTVSSADVISNISGKLYVTLKAYAFMTNDTGTTNAFNWKWHSQRVLTGIVSAGFNTEFRMTFGGGSFTPSGFSETFINNLGQIKTLALYAQGVQFKFYNTTIQDNYVRVNAALYVNSFNLPRIQNDLYTVALNS